MDPDDMIPDDIPELGDEPREDETPEHDPFISNAEADGDALASAGWGTDEECGCFGGGDDG